jgi:hypothetical protein
MDLNKPIYRDKQKRAVGTLTLESPDIRFSLPKMSDFLGLDKRFAEGINAEEAIFRLDCQKPGVCWLPFVEVSWPCLDV